MRVVSFKICPFVQRVTALLEAKGVPYDIEYIDLDAKPDWFLEAAPHGQVPILFIDEGRVLFESDAICEYIDEVTGQALYPEDPVEKAQARAWSYLASKNYLVQCSAQRSPDAATLDERAAGFTTAFAKIEQRLGERTFASGDSIGMVDIAWLPLLHRAAIIESLSGYDFLGDSPQAKAWQEAVLETGLPKKSVACDFEERFTSFYLAELTHLGQLARKRGGPVSKVEVCCSPEGMACCS